LYCGLFVAALHIACASNYGYFQDELYFIACAHHLALGYVDQPSFVAVAAWLSAPAAYALWLLRLLPALAAGATVWLAVSICARAGGSLWAKFLTAAAVATTPIDMLAGSILSSSSFEPLAWTALAYCFDRLLRERSPRWWLVAGGVLGAALWAKYTVVLFAAAFCLALLFSRERRLLASPWFAAGAMLAALLVLPNAVWQLSHGLPIVAVIHGDVAARHPLQNGVQLEFAGLLTNALAFVAENIAFANVFALPLWVYGLMRAPQFGRAWAILAVALIALDAKAYYLAGIYPALIAYGAAGFELRIGVAWMRAGAFAMAALNLPILPFTLPVLPLDTFVAYTRALGFVHPNGPQLIHPLYADELGWQHAVAGVAAAYDALPAAQRARTAVYADSYGYASAIAFYGSAYRLPAPISGSNNYALWGTRGYDGSSVLAVGATQYAELLRFFHRVRMVAVVRNPLRSVIEGPLPIYLCTGPVEPFPAIFAQLREYGA
jgi:4-amino-4-deoxy-L-arabinose transferase-like glycosyltransferase